VKPIINGNNSNKYKSVLVSIEKPPSLISTKLSKKINQISKFFRNLKQVPIDKSGVKSYVQASKLSNYTKKVIRIKNAFLFLNASKIDQVQKIIKGKLKSKSCI